MGLPVYSLLALRVIAHSNDALEMGRMEKRRRGRGSRRRKERSSGQKTTCWLDHKLLEQINADYPLREELKGRSRGIFWYLCDEKTTWGYQGKLNHPMDLKYIYSQLQWRWSSFSWWTELLHFPSLFSGTVGLRI